MPRLSAKYLKATSLLFVVGLFILIQAGQAQAQDSNNSMAEVDSTSDGPHIFRPDDSTFIVFYLCNDSIIRQIYVARDTLKFYGLCHDRDMEYTITAELPRNEPCRYDGISRIMAVSDIHGEYEDLVAILIEGGVVDSSLAWTWGDGHLVIVGDIFDRGNKVTECLWLIYRLANQARDDGGRVHFLLGNHELMILRGDDRYISGKYLDGIVRKSRIDHRDLFGPDMHLGRWLRTCPTVVRLNDILFVHGGISPSLLQKKYSPEAMNDFITANIDIRSSQLAFNDDARFLFGGEGPFWYRGYHYEMEGRYPRATSEEINSILDFYGSGKIVVGHTEVDQITTLYDGRIVAIDIPTEEVGGLQALIFENDRIFRLSSQGELIPLD